MLLPLSFDLKGKRILLIGGGRAALEKFSQLKRTGCKLTLVSPQFTQELEEELTEPHASELSVERREFAAPDLAGAFMVFSAVDNPGISRQVYELCKAQNILINSADDKAHCDFFTNAIVDRGSVQLSISTGGRFAGLSAVLRRHLEQLLPADLDADWERVFGLRERALALQSVIEKKSVITDIVNEIEKRYFKRSQES